LNDISQNRALVYVQLRSCFKTGYRALILQ
jgi:hypothetical protein